MTIIPVQVEEKLNVARSLKLPVYIGAPTGYGKTTILKKYYSKESVRWLSCKSGTVTPMKPVAAIEQKVIVVDDVSFLSDDKGIAYIAELIRSNKFVVLSSRSAFPTKLEKLELIKMFVCIVETDLRFGKTELEQVFSEYGAEVSEAVQKEILQISKGYPLGVIYFASLLAHDKSFGKNLVADYFDALFRYWEENAFARLDADFIDFLMKMYPYRDFTPDMARYMTGIANPQEIMAEIVDVGSFVTRTGQNTFSFREEVITFLDSRRNTYFTDAESKNNYKRAAMYYAEHNDLLNAVRYYDKAKAYDDVVDILIQNSQLHPGTGYYRDLKQYYISLPEEIVLKVPELMAGLSILYSMMLRPDESEQWYSVLKNYADDRSKKTSDRKRAKERLLYLDIALPHRAGKGLIKMFADFWRLCTSKGFKIPELSVTTNMPSVMNGSLDFASWSKHDTILANHLAKPCEAILGKAFKGLVNTSLAESGFVKASAGSYEILTRLNNAYFDASNGGTIEICFAAVGLTAKLHLYEGQYSTAVGRFESFCEYAHSQNAVQLYDNLEAFRVWLSLYMDRDSAESYIQTAPNEKTDFFITDRYMLIIKLRCLIALNRLTEALELSVFLDAFFRAYERTQHLIENNALRAVILFRLNDDNWQTVLTEALKTAEEYHFVRLIAFEGAAVLPLLLKMKSSCGENFYNTVVKETSDMALKYPDYLKFTEQRKIDLTGRETQVLALMCSGMSKEEICDTLVVSERTYKKHTQNIYKKLGVTTRADAERAARQYGLTAERMD